MSGKARSPFLPKPITTERAQRKVTAMNELLDTLFNMLKNQPVSGANAKGFNEAVDAHYLIIGTQLVNQELRKRAAQDEATDD